MILGFSNRGSCDRGNLKSLKPGEFPYEGEMRIEIVMVECADILGFPIKSDEFQHESFCGFVIGFCF